MFEVSKEVLPSPDCGKQKYPFHEIEVGKHFDAPRDMKKAKCGKYTRDGRQNSITASARAYAKKHNPSAKFTTRLIDENTVRCWRVA